MSSDPHPASAAPPPRGRKLLPHLRNFWQRITDGLELQQLWGQFRAEAVAGYGFYSKDVDWDKIRSEPRKGKRFFRAAWALFQALLMKLTPARRVLLLVAVLLVLIDPTIAWGSANLNFGLGSLGALILFLLLALELGDRVTMKRDLEIAREIQQWLVPAFPPQVGGFDIAFATRPQNTVAGDYYDAFLRPASPSGSGITPLLIAVADVAGKSVPAALLMATFQASLRALSATGASLDEIVVGIDRYARAHSLGGLRFTTSFIAEINPATREMRYVNAGHNDPILRRASGAMERLATGGPPFGLPQFTEVEIAYTSGRVQLEPGDLLFVFTDGVIEAVNDNGQEYGEGRLLPLLASDRREVAAATLERVMADVNAFVGYARQHDDITALVLHVSA